ncbi:hypothetical protein N0M98_06590 [Paenibacillus doosanensis]|uniref:Uncharacterized protein n=1 Tax=Paenibacillus konkukensis TaxID=2020716 RepID=A0ABY4RIY0_9BACL|nr:MULTISPECIES: hypothetical protein [Paenibacillus]MCS7459806.1 hypothetical protein [Paenibacillus doosanensis]UQZ81775.1 hypothetical protein SK3146_00931 [Paenibacillus konkukensis]
MNAPIVDRSNACYEDYIRFSKRTKYELAALQKSYYAELHSLREELDILLLELQNIHSRLNRPYMQTA